MTSYMEYPFYETLRTQDKWLLVFLYSYQIYADFFGYSAIAIGLGLLFGYRLPINFNLPYLSASFAEFWTRWHISLSSWLRTYLYIPLGGNRHGTARTYLNLMIVMGLGGLWHGAGLSYLMWGLLHGLFLVVERPILPHLKRSDLSLRQHTMDLLQLPNFDMVDRLSVRHVRPVGDRQPDQAILQPCAPVLASGDDFTLGARATWLEGKFCPLIARALYGAMAALDVS